MLRPARFSTQELPVETTAGLFYAVNPVLELDIEPRHTIYLTLKNASEEYADVTISFSYDGTDTNITTSVTLNPNEVVTLPTPTGQAPVCKIVSTEKLYLLKMEYEVHLAKDDGFSPFSINYGATTRKYFDLSGINVSLIAGSGLQILHTQPAETYCIVLTTNRPIHVLRGRVKYYVAGSITLLINGKYKQDLHIVAEQLTQIRLLLSATKLPAMRDTTNHTFTFQV